MHATHSPVEASQTGAAVGHSELVEQPQVLLPGRQTGLFVLHAPALPAEHSTHRPLKQTPFAEVGQGAELAEPLSPLHAPQVFVVALQTGLLVGQSLLDAHAQVLFTTLQMGDVGVHAVVLDAEHCSHRPPTHAGRTVDGHANDEPEPTSPLHVLQVCVPTSQTGVEAGHCELDSHPQLCVAATHTGVVPPHADALVSEHSRQAPPTHAGALADGHGRVVVEALSPSHGSQVPLVPLLPLQTGAAPGHSALLAHPQVQVLESHVGVLAPQAVALLGEHCTQAPLGRHAGAEASGHARVVADPKSPLHASQMLPLGSQIGAVAGQLALESQPQVLLATLQVGWPPVHAVALVAEHCSHRPATHARSAAVGHASMSLEPASLLHGLHV